MSADIQQIKSYLKEFKEPAFSKLFLNVLGWDRLSEAPSNIAYKGQHYKFMPLAEKRGFKIYLHTCTDHIPDMTSLKQLDERLEMRAAAHLTIFLDAKHENQLWLWVKRQNNHTPTYSTRLNKLQTGELLAQKVSSLNIDLEEEEKNELRLVDILNRVTQGFDVEKVTKAFYDGFQKQHGEFLKHIKNIDDEDDRKWYTSIMLNRLMFIYFIQMKGLLDNDDPDAFNGDREYLQHRLASIQKTSDDPYSFYRNFLLPLFHQGLSQREYSRELRQVIGNVRYLNGGIFDVHSLEEKYRNIQISNEAFKKLFDFLSGFTWHLDEHVARNDNEINPDVLGYIFEKYINQKQRPMGAYYTKEDITGYISKNTIIPALFEKVARQHPDAFVAGGPIWLLLQREPDKYIYEAMAHGVLEELPPEIAAGADDVAKRGDWNQLADERWALSFAEAPTETWREVVARRQRYHEVRELMKEGQISTINDLITYNLNITQFAADVIDHCEDAGLLRAFYDAITSVTILDPTCGSGAFLFAALNILRPLYQTCITRMQALIEKHNRKELKVAANHLDFFQGELRRSGSGSHHHQQYFILKSIIVNNLYGVDIMEEAIEICKLRLFLNLVAQLETPEDLEPLPDIDFNMLAGNTLVGFTSLDEIRQVATKLFNVDDTEKTLQLIEQDALEIERDEQSFRNMQTRQGVDIDPATIAEYKRRLRKKLERLRGKLDPYLATEYQITREKYKDTYDSEYLKWHKSHKPFHWWAEFHEIMHNGGFDVIIGNPPYVEYREVKNQYKIQKYKTEVCGNLYAFSVEKMKYLLGEEGRFGVIIPVASVCTDGYLALQKILTEAGSLIISNYNDRPSKLFEGLEHIRLSIILYKSDKETRSIFTTKYNKWSKEERERLFNKLVYTKTTAFMKDGSIPKLQAEFEKDILQKVLSQKKILSFYARKSSSNLIYYTRKLSGFVQVLDRIPLIYDDQGQKREPSELKSIAFETTEVRDIFLSVLNSSLFYWFLTIYSDCRNLNKREIYTINFDFERAAQNTIQSLSSLSKQLMMDFVDHSKMLEMKYEKQGRLLIQCFYPKHSKPIIDEIDRILAQHYGFTPEELDYIINYDIKYRMGRDNGEESESE